jgi:hypothetical protein
MDLKLTVKPNSPALKHFSPDVLNALASSLAVRLAPGDLIVHHGVSAPADRSKKWQLIDAYGTPVGNVKSWNGTTWA